MKDDEEIEKSKNRVKKILELCTTLYVCMYVCVCVSVCVCESNICILLCMDI